MSRVLVVFASYLLGSLPFSFLIARAWGVADVRQVGSGNVGATNVMRNVGRFPGILALILDAAKGAAAVLCAKAFDPSPTLGAAAATAAILGHMFPAWLGFRGGKGVATGAGAFLVLAPPPTVVALLTFVVTLGVLRFVSVGSMLATTMLAVACLVMGLPKSVTAAAALNAALIVYQHRTNIVRLRQGTESRLGQARRSSA